MGFHRPQNFCGMSFHRLQNFCGMLRAECPVTSGNLKPKFAEIANGTTWYRDISCLPLKPPQSFKPRIVIKTGFFVFLWIWPEPVRGSQREENFQKTSLKARKKILRVSAATKLFLKLVFSTLWPFYCFYFMYASFRSVTAENGEILTPTRTGNFLLTSMDPEFYATSFYRPQNFCGMGFHRPQNFCDMSFHRMHNFCGMNFYRPENFCGVDFHRPQNFCGTGLHRPQNSRGMGFRRPQNFCVKAEIALLFFIHAIWNVCTKNFILISRLHGLLNYKYLFFTFSLGCNWR